MIVNPDVDVYQTTPDNDCIRFNQRFQNFFERDRNLTMVNILRPKSETAYLNMTKMLCG